MENDIKYAFTFARHQFFTDAHYILDPITIGIKSISTSLSLSFSHSFVRSQTIAPNTFKY